MLLTALMLLQLGAADLEVTGDAEGPAATEEQREELRLRGAIHFAVAGGFSGFAPGGGPGFSAELGATWADRFSLSVRATVGTILMWSTLLAGLAFDMLLGERFSLGVALSLALIGGVVFVFDLPASFAVALPVRLSFAPFGRKAQDVARKGLVLFLEAGPAYGLRMSPGRVPVAPPRPSPLSFTAAIGVGYSVW